LATLVVLKRSPIGSNQDDFSVLGGRRRGQPAASSGSEGVANISFKL
jgi:hypothetical protein